MESLDTEFIINHLQANWGLFEKNRIIPGYHYIGAAIQSYEEAVACANRIQWTIDQARNNYQKNILKYQRGDLYQGLYLLARHRNRRSATEGHSIYSGAAEQLLSLSAGDI